jgi:hypothetical protein
MRRFWIAVGLIVVLMLVSPIGVYIYTFGFKISDIHARWGEMGSAMSGIYGPILALLAFGVLVVQVILQRQTTRLEFENAKHMHDQVYLQDARADIQFYLTQMVEALDKVAVESHTARDVLRIFERATVEQLSNAEVKRLSDSLDSSVPQVQALWMAIYPIFAGLSSRSQYDYSLQFVSAKQKTIAMLSYPICAALDNYLYCRVEGNVIYAYEFSTQLAERETA